MHDLLDAHPVTLAAMLQEAERELHLRLSVYPRQVKNCKITQQQADHRIRLQRAIIERLRNSPNDGTE